MSRAAFGLLVGMALGFAGWFGGFAAFLLVAALGAVGFIVGRAAEGRLELTEFLDMGSRRR